MLNLRSRTLVAMPLVGAGIRDMLSKDKRINARIDYAFGVNGNDGLYLGIMEAF